MVVKVYDEHRHKMVIYHPNLHVMIDEASAKGGRHIVYFNKGLSTLDMDVLRWLDYNVEDMKNGAFRISW
ncbi:MAG: hypothetical protein ACRDDY_03445 [Clostridium sp.]